MGNLSCCLKPEEKIAEIKGSQIQAEIIEDYPHDSNLIRAQGNAQLEAEGLKETSNQYDSAIKSPKSNEQNEQENNLNMQSPKDGDATNNNYIEQDVNSPKQEEANPEEAHNEEQVEEQRGGEDGEEAEQVEEQGNEQGEEEGEEQVEEQVEEEGEEQVEEQVEEEGEEQGEEQGQFDGQDPLIGETIAETTYINASNNNKVQNGEETNVQIIKNEEDLNQYFSEVGNIATNNANTYLNSYNQDEGFANAASNQEAVDLNSLQVVSSIARNDNLNQYIQQDVETANESTGKVDYSQYFQQGTTVSGNVDLNSYGTTVPSSTGNEQLNQYFQNAASSQTFDLNLGQSSTDNADLGQYNFVAGTTSNMGNTDLNSYDIQGNGFSSNDAAISQSYVINAVDPNITFGEQNNIQNFNEYQSTRVVSTKVENSYVGPTKTYSYSYNYNVPTTSPTQF